MWRSWTQVGAVKGSEKPETVKDDLVTGRNPLFGIATNLGKGKAQRKCMKKLLYDGPRRALPVGAAVVLTALLGFGILP
jgi:hypothetical protein